MVRKLNKVELTVKHWSMSTMTEFETCRVAVELDHIREAMDLTIEKYDYLKLRVEKNSHDEFWFVRNSPHDALNYTLEYDDIESEDEFNAWEKRFINFGSRKYVGRLFNIKIESYLRSKYRLYLSINHAGH